MRGAGRRPAPSTPPPQLLDPQASGSPGPGPPKTTQDHPCRPASPLPSPWPGMRAHREPSLGPCPGLGALRSPTVNEDRVLPPRHGWSRRPSWPVVCDCSRRQSCSRTRFGSLRGSQRPGDPDPHESAQLPTQGGGKGCPRGLAWHCSCLTVHPQIALSGPPFALCAERGSAETGAPSLAGSRGRPFFHKGTFRPSSGHSPWPRAH